ncbi:MAG: hypothetical protein ABWJ42_02100, partial [Sulfolobales archaeon]
LVGLPRIEDSVRELSSVIESIISRWRRILLPLPRGLCEELILLSIEKSLDYEDLQTSIFRYLNSSLERIWRPVIRRIYEISRRSEFWDRSVECYLENDFVERLRETGYTLAYLLFQANVFNKVDLDRWLELFRRDKRVLVETLARELVSEEPTAVVVDSYVDFIELKKFSNNVRSCVVYKLIPTPLELLEIIGLDDRELALEIVRWAIRYLNRVVYSREISEVYREFLEDNNYIVFTKSLGLDVIQDKCVF